MKVIYIRDSKSRGYLRIGLSDGEEKLEYTVSEKEYAELGSLLVGDEVGDSEALSECDMRYRARLYALRILSFGDNSELTLKRKLIAKSVSPRIAAEISREMVSLGYVNEKRQLERLIEAEANTKLFGRAKIIPRLIAKGFPKDKIESVIRHLISHGIVDFEKNKRILIEKKLGADADSEEIKKLLYKFGHYDSF